MRARLVYRDIGACYTDISDTSLLLTVKLYIVI